MNLASPFSICIVTITVLSLLGLPIGHAMIAGSVLYLLLAGQDMGTVAERWLKNSVETLPAASIYQNASLQQWASLIVAGINSERAKAGLPALKTEPHLALAAQAHARDMALRNYFAHDTPEGFGNFGRLEALDPPTLEWWAENAAKGQESVDEVISGWMASQKHHDNMLSNRIDYVGVGVYYDPADASMPIHVIADFARFDFAPEGHDWYQRGDVNR